MVSRYTRRKEAVKSLGDPVKKKDLCTQAVGRVGDGSSRNGGGLLLVTRYRTSGPPVSAHRVEGNTRPK